MHTPWWVQCSEFSVQSSVFKACSKSISECRRLFRYGLSGFKVFLYSYIIIKCKPCCENITTNTLMWAILEAGEEVKEDTCWWKDKCLAFLLLAGCNIWPVSFFCTDKPGHYLCWAVSDWWYLTLRATQQEQFLEIMRTRFSWTVKGRCRLEKFHHHHPLITKSMIHFIT